MAQPDSRLDVPLSRLGEDVESTSSSLHWAEHQTQSVELTEVWRRERAARAAPAGSAGGWRPKGKAFWTWVLEFLVAALVAVCAQVVHYGQEQLSSWRTDLAHWALGWGVLGCLAANLSATLAYVAIAHACTVWQPSTVSSGIPGVIAFLNGVDVRRSLFSVQILVAKILGVVFACGSSLAVGPEGPMIHIGATAGVLVFEQFCRFEFFQRALKADQGAGLSFLRQRWRQDGPRGARKLRLEIFALSALSAAAGVLLPAAAECQESTLQRAFANSNQCISQEWGHQIFKTDHFSSRLMEPTAGLFGVQYNPSLCPQALFSNVSGAPECHLEKLGLAFPKDLPERERYFYCCGFSDMASFHQGKVYSFTAPKAPLELSEEWPAFGCQPLASGNISIPRYNAMAALAFVPGRTAVKNLFTRGSPHMLPTGYIASFLAVYFCLAACTAGSAVPSGLVVPMMIIGGCVGRIVGNTLTKLFGSFWDCPAGWVAPYQMLLQMLPGQASMPQTCGLPDPGSFAVVGAAAFMSGSGSIVLFVIAMLVEITGDIQQVLPIAFGALTGRCVVRGFIGHGLYHDLLQVTNLSVMGRECPLGRSQRRGPVSALLAGGSSLRLLRARETRPEVQHLLQACPHHGFPVSNAEGRLIGLARREQLQQWLAESQEERSCRSRALRTRRPTRWRHPFRWTGPTRSSGSWACGI
ncbi:unnamed protein product [Effrenium voratum]|nr:unnamed protein product [Effrenium voratum]